MSNYYGKLANGTYGWNNDLLSFKKGGVTDAIQGSNFYNGEGGVGAIGGYGQMAKDSLGLGDVSILGGTKPDGKGGTSQTMGAGGLALGIFDSWNSWNQGNKMYDLQEKAFDFSQDKYWNNFMMQRGLMNREINRQNGNQNTVNAYRRGGMTDQEYNTLGADNSEKFNETGGLVRNDGTTYNMSGNGAPTEFNAPSTWTQPYQSQGLGATATPVVTGTPYGDAAKGYESKTAPSTPKIEAAPSAEKKKKLEKPVRL